jgi:asparagine synthetase A
MNKKDYESKLACILSDTSKFEKIIENEEKVITKLKKKVNDIVSAVN